MAEIDQTARDAANRALLSIVAHEQVCAERQGHIIQGLVELKQDVKGLFLRFWRANLPAREDGVWVARISDVLSGHEERLPEIGKYNAGQKFVFWSMSALILVLITSGVVIWDQYFSVFTTIEQKRIAVLIHAAAAVFAICVWIVHVYAAIWVKGTIGAMTRGRVTGGWAWRHHRKWLRELVGSPRRAPSNDCAARARNPPA